METVWDMSEKEKWILYNPQNTIPIVKQGDLNENL